MRNAGPPGTMLNQNLIYFLVRVFIFYFVEFKSREFFCDELLSFIRKQFLSAVVALALLLICLWSLYNARQYARGELKLSFHEIASKRGRRMNQSEIYQPIEKGVSFPFNFQWNFLNTQTMKWSNMKNIANRLFCSASRNLCVIRCVSTEHFRHFLSFFAMSLMIRWENGGLLFRLYSNCPDICTTSSRFNVRVKYPPRQSVDHVWNSNEMNAFPWQPEKVRNYFFRHARKFQLESLNLEAGYFINGISSSLISHDISRTIGFKRRGNKYSMRQCLEIIH